MDIAQHHALPADRCYSQISFINNSLRISPITKNISLPVVMLSCLAHT